MFGAIDRGTGPTDQREGSLKAEVIKWALYCFFLGLSTLGWAIISRGEESGQNYYF